MNIDLEKVVALRPDLVVADAGLESRVVASLERTGLPLLAVAPRNLAEVLKSLDLIARATGHTVQGRTVVAQLNGRIEKLKAAGRAAVAKRGAPQRVFALLDAAELYTAGPGTFMDELVRLAGGVNIAGDSKAAWPLFSEEALLARDPEVIVVTYFPRSEVLRRPRWQGITAVKAGRVYTVDPDIISRPGPRLVDGLAALVRILGE
jgi:iron complex transport system substrate-binding protein